MLKSMRLLLLIALLLVTPSFSGCRSLAGYEPVGAPDAAVPDTSGRFDTLSDGGVERVAADVSIDLPADGGMDVLKDASIDLPDASQDLADDLMDGMYSVEQSVLILDATTPGEQCTLWTLTIAADEDDAEIDGSALLPDGESYVSVDDPGGIYIGSWAGRYTWGIFRFRLPQGLPPDATIRSARLKLWGHLQWPNWDTTQDALVVRLEDNGQAPVVTSADEAPESALGWVPAHARPVVSKSITWPPVGGLTWTIGDYNESPDLAPMLAQLRQNHPDPSAWTSLQLWLRGLYTDRNAEVLTFDYGMSDFHTPQLQIVWCAP